jgi:hypothetical protein
VNIEVLKVRGGQEKHSYITDINAVSAKFKEVLSVVSTVILLPKHGILIYSLHILRAT